MKTIFICRPNVARRVKTTRKQTDMRTINIYLREHKIGTGSGIIWIKFYVNRQKVNFSTGVSCLVKHWSKTKECISDKDSGAADKNLIIENIRARINNVFVKYRLKDKVLTREAFLRAYNRPDDYATFFDFVKDWQKKFSYKNEEATMSVHRTVIKKLREHAPDLHFDDITKEWLDEYYAYLRKKLKNCENTAYKNMSTLRKYVRAAYKAGYMDEYPFDDWSIKRTKASYTYLKEEELTILLNAYRDGQFDFKFHKALEFFLFMCFSSLHIGDAKKLKLEQFTNDSFTYFRIKNRNSKPEPIIVPVSDILQKIISNIVGYRKKGLIFESLPADQTMNGYLKDVAEELELSIGRDISHKTGRHTFATYFLKKTKDLTALKEILGHSELRETLIYAHVLDESKQEGIQCFNSFNL